ncbi:nuclease-related domain-containing protein [Neobacillus rhizosphaerae]|uniref:nuclease-related domain-containing protein n=1 Tax=Neobacillus rhizosphaerae TaxID=2880965 RepID=UPI003D2CBFC7
MLLKPRYKSNELIIMKSLFMRTNLSPKDKKYYLKLEKGYQGEVMFDQYTSKLQNDLYFINDLCLDFNNANFQIDTLTISQSTIFPFEVKNFEGNYYYEKDSFFTLSRDEVQNPLDQLKRSSTLLRQLIKNIGFY